MQAISLIVPVYNAEDSIVKTLDSLLNQTYQNIEVICVNDGSTDQSLKLLHQYANEYPETIAVVHQDNQGVSVARNTGINHATGGIIMFVDADDELVSCACERVAQVFSDSDTEVFTFGFMCNPVESMPLGMSKVLRPPAKSYSKFEPDLLFSDATRPYTCRTAISRSLLVREDIRFEPGVSLGEDQIIYFLLYPLSRKTVLSPEQLYIYNMQDQSATHANAADPLGAEKKLCQHMQVVETILREWSQRKLNHLCRPELLDWILDFVLFDINGLEEKKKTLYLARLLAGLDAYFQEDLTHVAHYRSTKKCLEDIRRSIATNKNDSTSPLKKTNIIHLAAFYCRRYGFVRCFQQLLISLGIIKKWK